MIIGVGTDIVIIDRINKIYAKHGQTFLDRILTKSELEQFLLLKEDSQIRFLAKRYAAKEAVAKAFGTGIGTMMKFHDIIISNDPSGAPIAKVIADIGQNKKISISISDDPPIAVAFALIYQ